MKPKTLYMLDKHSTTELCPNPQKLFVTINFWDFNVISMVKYDIVKITSTVIPGSVWSEVGSRGVHQTEGRSYEMAIGR